MWFVLFKENLLFALHALTSNKLRTFLSLLGITIGIFAIISVFTIVDSLERSLRNDVKALGDDVVFIQKWPWTFGPNYPWWKYLNRPVPQLQELPEVQKRTKNADAVSFQISVKTVVKYESSSAENVDLLAVSQDYDRVKQVDILEGRYFSEVESANGKPVCIIGYEIATSLFPNSSALDKEIKIRGHKLTVIGVLKKKGESILGGNQDTYAMVPINFARSVISLNNEFLDPYILVKAKKGITNNELIDELAGVMRSVRKLKPLADDNFALNQTSLISNQFDSLFNIIGVAGAIIGGFSILVGGFGIANIMFVSVKERTNLIGIQKSLGAKNYFILLQFLIESVILSVIGCILGLLIIFIGTLLIGDSFGIDVSLSINNIVLGLTISVLIGIISGFVPAYGAAQLDPVEAIRST